jgi:hypothetical protein
MHGNPTTDSFTTANGGTYATTNSQTGGDVGTNGNVSLIGNAMVGGAVGVPIASTGPCPANGLTLTGNAGIVSLPGNGLQQAGPFTFPTPPSPNPPPPNANYSGSTNLVPGTYGNISLSGKSTLTLAPGVYNINSISVTGQGTVTISPPGAVVLNFPATSASPISIAGNGISNSDKIANDFQINYGGTGTISLAGNGQSYCIVDAPNASLSVAGNGDFYGRMIGATIDYGGNGKFHFDKNSALAPQSNGNYNLISFRDFLLTNRVAHRNRRAELAASSTATPRKKALPAKSS